MKAHRLSWCGDIDGYPLRMSVVATAMLMEGLRGFRQSVISNSEIVPSDG
jgi:hypothetical protein